MLDAFAGRVAKPRLFLTDKMQIALLVSFEKVFPSFHCTRIGQCDVLYFPQIVWFVYFCEI